jgi:hypothetical protein
MIRNEEVDRAGSAARRLASHVEDLLDEALMETFPASDPISICVDQGEGSEPPRSDKHVPRAS